MITVKYLFEVPLQNAVEVWNKGFEGYDFNVATTIDKFLARIVIEDLSLEYSLVAFDEDRPIAIVMNGFRLINGKKTAWNGGTGISPEYRGKGIGKLLMEKNLQLYRELGVDVALLEAIRSNKSAVNLYQNVGYHIQEHLICLQQSGVLNDKILQPAANRYILKRGRPSEVKELCFYRNFSAWQTQWPSLKEGESLILSDGNIVVGYALYKKINGKDGNSETIVLYQCESKPDRVDKEEILKALLCEVYDAPFTNPVKRLAINISDNNKELLVLLKKSNFSSYLDQHHMELQLKDKS